MKNFIRLIFILSIVFALPLNLCAQRPHPLHPSDGS